MNNGSVQLLCKLLRSTRLNKLIELNKRFKLQVLSDVNKRRGDIGI